jgi:hypothetical protein
MSRRVRVSLVLVLLAVGTGIALQDRLIAQGKDSPSDPALERTRKQVRMLDDLYKTAVVLITEKYVNSDTDLPAGSAAKALFGAMKKKGWHEARLVDATGDPLIPGNAPADDFENEAVRQLLAGKAGHEQVVEKEGKRYLRAATPVPVVLKKCTMCHENYKSVKEGRPIGAISYIVPIE